MTSLGLTLGLGLSARGGGGEGAALLAAATARYSATSITTGTEQSLPNLNDTTQRATLGSVDGAEVTDDGLRLPGANGNYASVASFAGANITGDIAISGSGRLSDWASPSVEHNILTKWETASTKQYMLVVTTAGALRLYYSLNGTTTLFETSSEDPSVSDGDVLLVGVERNATTGVVKFYTRATTSDSWAQLGTDRAGTPGALNTSASPVKIGSTFTGSPTFTGTIQSAQLIDGDLATGTVVASPDFEAAANGTGDVTDAQSNVWSIATTGADANDPTLTVGPPKKITFDGVDRFIQTVHTPTFTATTGKHATLILARRPDTASHSCLFSSESDAVDGVRVRWTSGSNRLNVYLGGATTLVNTANLTTAAPNVWEVLGFVVTDGALRAFTATTGFSAEIDITGVGTITHAPARIGAGAYVDLPQPADGDINDVVDMPGVGYDDADAIVAAAAIMLASA